jgi:uncharacterized protein (DUF169 family)
MDLEKSEKVLTEILGLKHHPIAVKFFEKDEDLEEITHSLQKLNEKALPRVRGKTIYKALISR